MDKLTWEKKKAHLRAQQEAFSGKLLKRVHITKLGKVITDHEAWPATREVLQRIATHMDPDKRFTPLKVMRKLEGGDKLTNRFGDVYSLVSVHTH